MIRYVTTLSLSVEFDAEDDEDATNVAEQLADTVSIPTPRGRNAHLHPDELVAIVTRTETL